jgi:mannose-1-phosphate guanylyltransferase
MPADHHIAPAAGFRSTIGDAIVLAAANDAIVVVGITPTRAESGFGYQKIGRVVGAGFRVDRFIEKPSPARARQMVRSGKFLWNAGMFVVRIDRLEAQLETHAPALAAAMRRMGETSRRPTGRTDLARIYRRLDFDSFDRVVAEKSRNVLGVRARFRWHDVGSWEGLWEAMRGEGRNVLSGNVVALGADGVLARGGKRLMVLLGVSDLIAVDTGDAVLIARRSESQEIRRVIDELRRRGMGRYL